MNSRIVVSVVVMFVLFTGFGFLVHGTILHPDYERLGPLMRSPTSAQPLFPLMLVADLLMAIGFTWLYVGGRESAKPWLGQGARFGVAAALFQAIPMYLIYYVVMPFPSDLVAQQVFYGTISMVIAGIVVAWLNR